MIFKKDKPSETATSLRAKKPERSRNAVGISAQPPGIKAASSDEFFNWNIMHGTFREDFLISNHKRN